jgi:NAD(P)H-flavin reductase
MRRLAELYPQFKYTPCVSAGAVSENVTKGRANEVAMATLGNLKGWRIFLCGHPDMVLQSKKMAFLNGAAFQDIYADAFHLVPALAE